MIRVGLIGTLADHFNELSRASIRTCVIWQRALPASAEKSSLDLILYLQADENSPAVSSWKQTAHRSVLSIWNAVPTPRATDQAVQDSLTQTYGFVVGYSEDMHLVCHWIRSVIHQASLALDLRTLIVGESGTGKELVASAIHKMGMRRNAPFIAVNLSATPRDLISSELFGHKRGAFTGADQSRQGALATAAEGILFLDEIGDMPMEIQPLLLRVLEQRVFSPLGSLEPIALKAQVISATNKSLAQEIGAKTFRADLYFRLAHVVIQLPSLRERKEDMPILVKHFLKLNNYEKDMEPGILDELVQYDWPGNVRELKTAVERYLLLSSVGERPSVESLLGVPPSDARSEATGLTGTLSDLREGFERKILKAVLARCGGDTALAAQELGVTRRSIYNLAKRHGLELKSGED